ncbi:hypothetical protein A0H81_03245 [Grifola frondosa]|uniref:Uncharacterized protein n=1 Tax=Grifola frondosa TaxID=5627 RepID=A0A1C7MJT5_GRIFR|nr:hypothetical protein A0H81_03245 [Grifola frondosa]
MHAGLTKGYGTTAVCGTDPQSHAPRRRGSATAIRSHAANFEVFFPLPKSDVSRPKYQSWQESRRTLPSLPCIVPSSTAHPALQASYSPTIFAFSYATGARNRTRQFTGAPTDSATLRSSDFGLPAPRASTSLRGTRNSRSAVSPPQVGPLKFLRKLHSATYGETFAVTDIGSGRALCAYIGRSRGGSRVLDGIAWRAA